ncbi:glycosyltransferase [Neobacillus sedimentimangrovi]|uniref:Glycosyltransferase n=2 Tax=Neobacillus TaxID=2675232 RepID=A0A6B3TNE7_9BACI|nr:MULTISPECIES: glycosyltransferase [Neobacillus]MCD4838316.1 glycosyltransferase [Neobacillus sedimentimangrovi]NEX78188.1 glycosyltransferase [Neobacillus thermocopriae]
MDERAIQQRLSTLSRLKLKLKLDIENEKNLIEKGGIKKPVSNPTPPPVANSQNKLDVNKKAEYLRLRDKQSDKNFFNKIKPLLEQIPESNGSRYFEKLKVNIGIIADEFLFNSYKDIANFIYITRENYKKYSKKLDVFLVVSTWKGLNMEWKGLGNPKIRKHRQDLKQIIEFYRSQGTKIVFYSKEDPVNYEIFIDIAKMCDYIFTTAEEKISDYQRDCKNENVFVLDFGINPMYHNPIGIKKFPKRKEVLFTGSWYEKYPHRQKDTRTLFDGVIESKRDLKIIDRNYELNLEAYFFPEKYLKYVSPSVDHHYLQKLHKMFDWAINLNTVQDSNTMFANRVYELQALGNVLLSNYSVGVNNRFPNVFLVNNKNEIKDILNGFSEEEVFEHQVQGIRNVMTDHTSYLRIEELLDRIGFKLQIKKKKVAVLIEKYTPQLKEMFEHQTYPHKELFLIKDFSEEQKNEYDFITFFEDQKFYGEFYLEDMINGFKYTNSDYITKDAYYDGDKWIQGKEFDYVNTVTDKYRTVFWSQSFSLNELLELKGPKEIPNGFSIDRFEFNNQIVKKKETKPVNYKLSVIIASYNNGKHLLNKCFNSLRRSSLFKDMEIVIVDDGSTDNYTPMIIRRLEREFANVKSFFYQDGGSGSASRPRNKGFELTTAPYITYLDPDNEAINDGYYHLYKEISKNRYDMVVGNMLKLDTKAADFDYYKTAVHFNGSDVISKNVKEYLVKSQFKAMSIQALIFKRELIVDHSLKMVEGAAGEDTLFFQELLLNSKKTKVINLPIHIYYAAVSGSTVNTISKRFFEKYLLLEKTRVKVLKENGLLQDFLDKRFDFYFKGWYLEKLKHVTRDEALDSIKILVEIYDLYRNDFNPTSEQVIRFKELSASRKYEEIKKLFAS